MEVWSRYVYSCVTKRQVGVGASDAAAFRGGGEAEGGRDAAQEHSGQIQTTHQRDAESAGRTIKSQSKSSHSNE